jgi:universal stress protein E
MSQPIRRILVAVRDLDCMDLAAHKAAQLSRRMGAELCLFHAITEPLYFEIMSYSRQSIHDTEASRLAAVTARLEKTAAPLRSENLKVCVDAAWDYPSQDAVIRTAIRWKADMVVVDCPRYSHMAPWFMHFTDWELMRSCPVPVLLIKSHVHYTRAPVLAALDPEHSHGKPPALDADIVDYAGQLAAALDDYLHVVYAFNPMPDLAASELVMPLVVAEVEQQGYDTAHHKLDPVLEKLGIAPKRRHIEEGCPIDVIERVVRDTGAQILVMGSVSRSGLKGLFIGNTAERLLDRLGCDLLVIKPAGFHHSIEPVPRGAQVVPAPAVTAAMAASAVS